MSEYLRKILGAGKTPLTKSKPIAALTADAGPDIPGGDGANEGFWRSQLRDPKTQQFIEMGGGIICTVTLPDGTVAKGTGFFKGNSSPGVAIIEFKGSEGVPDGQYNVPHENILGQADAIIPAKDLARAIDKADGVIDDPKNKKTRVRKMSMEGEEALSKIKGDAALVAKEQGRFPIARGPEDIKAAAKKQYEGVFAALQKEHPDLVKDFKSFDAFWDHAEKNIAIDTSQRWADSVDEIPELTKATNRIYAREVLGLDPDGLITFYRNSINHHDNPDKAAAGYISLDQRMAWNYNSDKEQSGYDGRYAVKAAPDEVLGLLGYSKIADEYGVVVGPDVTSQPNRYERVGDLAWTPLNPLMDPKKTQMGTTGDSWFRHFRPASSFDFPVMDSKPFEDGEGWPDFYKQFNLQKGDIPNKYDELHGEGAFDQDFPESKGVPNYANFVKYAFTEKDGKYAFDPIYLSSGEFSASNATSMEPDKGDKIDLGLKFLSTIQELSGKAFMVHRSHDKNDERLKDAQIETPKAEEPKGSDFSAIGYSKEESLKDFLDPANGVVVAPGSMVKNKEGKSVVADDAFFMAGNFPYYKTPEQTLLNYGEIVLPDAGKEPEEAIKLRYDWIEKNKDKFLQTNNYKFKELARKKAAELGYNDEQAEVYAAAMQNSLFSYLYSKASILAHDLLDYTYKNYPEQYKDSEAYKKLEKISEFESKLAEYTDKVAKANVAVAVEGMDLISVLNDGRIKNQFETMKSRGAYDPENRIKNELIVSGTPIDTPAQKRSIFGYLFTSDQASTRSEDSRSDGNILHLGNRYTDSYGKFKVVLKPSIKERTTFTVGDSLERGSQNSQILSQNLDRQAMKEAGLVTGADIALNQTPATLLGTYLEAQIHGGISLSDIERIVYTGDESDETLQLVKTKIKDLGLSISVEGLKSDQGAKDFTGFKKVSGPLGSNEGGLYEDPSDGTKYYVKVQNKERGENEALGSALYEEAGLDALKVNHGILDGKPATYTEWREDLRPIRTYLSEIRPDDPVMDGYAVDAWLANWDVVGTAYDNLSFKTGGEPVRLDAGGSLLYRARGERKGSAFGEEVGELETFKDDSNTTGQLYGKMSPEAEKKSVERLAKITPERIDALVDEYISDPNDNKELKEKLKARREFILKKYETETPTNDNKPIESGYENWFDKLADIEKKAKKLTDEEGIENSYFYEVIKAAGFDKKPELVSEESLSTSKSPKLYRGVTSPKQIEDLKNSDKLFMGKGDFGNGLYFSTNQNAATIWAKKGATKDTGNADASEKEIKERMATAVLADDAKILSFSDGMKILSWAIDQRKLFTEKYREKYPKGSEGSVDIVGKFFEDMDFPSLMVMSGYDAFEFEDGDLGGSTVIVLNRGKLKVATPQEDQFAEKKPETKVKKLGNEPNVKASDEKIDMLISKISRLKIEDVEKLKDAIKNGTLTNELADELSAKAPGSLDIVNDPVMLKAMLKRHVGDSVSPDEMQDLIDGKRTKDNYGFYHASNRELKVGDIIRPTESFDASARHGGLSFDIKKEMSPEEWEKKRAFALLDGGQKVKGLSFYISRAAEISGEPDGMGYFYRVKPVGTLSAFPSLEPEWNTDGGWEIVNVVGKASIHDGMVDSRIHFDEDTDTMWHDEPEEYNSPDYGKRETDDIIDTSSGDMPVLSQIIKTEKTNEVGKGTVTLATEFEYVGHRNWDSSYLDDDEIEAITEYRAGGYAQINELLRTARLKDSEVPEEKVQKWIDTLDSAIDTWGSPMRGSVRNVVYRGQVLSGGSAPEVGEADMAKIISNLSPGMILEDRGFLSASTSPTIAYKEFGPGLYERGAVKGDTAFWAINVPDDVNALFSPNDIGIAAEKELIFHRNSKLAIKGIRKITGEDGHSRYFIEADMLAPESELIPKTREESSESSPELAETLAEIAKNREEPVAPTVDTFTEDEGKSLEYYSRGASETSFIINEFLRNNKVFDPKAYLGVDDDQDPDVIKNEKELNYIVDNVENAIYKYGRIESPTTLYRGIEEYEDGLLENLSVGDTISEPGFSSTSVKESVAKGFTDRDGFRTSAIFKINAPENSYGLRLGEDLYEKYPYFGTSNAMQGSEVLLPSNTKFKITSIKKEPMLSSETGKETGKYLYSIEVDLIPQEPKIVETKKPKSNKPKVEEKAGSTKYKTPLSRILEEQDEDPNQDILVYAKVPEDTKEGSIPPGTLVTTDESIAEVFYGSGKVIKFSIPAKHLLADKKNFDDDPVMSYNPPTSEPEKPEEPKVEENPYLAKSRGPIRNERDAAYRAGMEKEAKSKPIFSRLTELLDLKTSEVTEVQEQINNGDWKHENGSYSEAKSGAFSKYNKILVEFGEYEPSSSTYLKNGETGLATWLSDELGMDIKDLEIKQRTSKSGSTRPTQKFGTPKTFNSGLRPLLNGADYYYIDPDKLAVYIYPNEDLKKAVLEQIKNGDLTWVGGKAGKGAMAVSVDKPKYAFKLETSPDRKTRTWVFDGTEENKKEFKEYIKKTYKQDQGSKAEEPKVSTPDKLSDEERLKQYKEKEAQNEANLSNIRTTQNVSETESQVVNGYTNANYMLINGYLRNPDDPKKQSFKKQAEDLNNVINANTLNEDTVLYRVTGNIDADFQPGDIIDDLGIQSTTKLGFNRIHSTVMDKLYLGHPLGSEAEEFLGHTRYTIKAPAGSKALDVTEMSQFRQEGEVLLPAGTKFKVISYESVPLKEPYPGRIRKITVEIVDSVEPRTQKDWDAQTGLKTTTEKPVKGRKPGFENWNSQILKLIAAKQETDPVKGNTVQYKFIKEAGFNGKPTILSQADFDALEGETIYRAVGSEGQVKHFKESEVQYAGSGSYGNGTYASNIKKSTEYYAGDTNGDPDIIESRTMEMKLLPDANVVTFEEETYSSSDVSSALRKYVKELSNEFIEQYKKSGADPGEVHEVEWKLNNASDWTNLAIMKGVDAIRFKVADAVPEEYYTIILNRGKVAINGKS